MQRVQRKFGTLFTRSEDDSDVGALLQQYDITDNYLAKVNRFASSLYAFY